MNLLLFIQHAHKLLNTKLLVISMAINSITLNSCMSLCAIIAVLKQTCLCLQPALAWFLLSGKSMCACAHVCVCVCVSTSKTINYNNYSQEMKL